MEKPKHPMQPIAMDNDGVVRFRQNKIVRFLIDWASSRGMDMNALAIIPFDADEREQFAQLIGYSVSGFGDLGYSSKEAIEAADEEAERIFAQCIQEEPSRESQ